MTMVPLGSMTANVANQRADVIVRRRDGGSFEVIDGARRLEAQIDVYGFADVSVDGRETIRVKKVNGMLVESGE